LSKQRAAAAFDEALLEDDPVQLYERAPCGYLSTTPEGRIVKANATFATWTGYGVEELTARSFVDLLSVGGRIYHETHYAPMLRMEGAVREIAVDVVCKDGRRLPVLVNARLDRDEDGHARVVRIAVFDATQRREYERELLRAKDKAEQSERRARTLARTLQETLIPPEPPSIPHLDAAAAYRPAGDGTEVGGDFYDVFPLGPDDWIVVLGDVCGKGAEAAVVTALVRYTIRTLATSEAVPSGVLARLNEAMLRHETNRFCTVVLARLRRTADGWRAALSVGGHPPPVLVRRGGLAEQLPVEGSLVGVFADAHFADLELRLEPGDALLLHTDGVTEAQRGAEFFGEARLAELVNRCVAVPRRGNLAEDMVAGVLDEVLTFQSGVARDDIAVLAIAVPVDTGG
jgi:sigma-B regulation protein RsbU (phosphoserine phosphatase)